MIGTTFMLFMAKAIIYNKKQIGNCPRLSVGVLLSPKGGIHAKMKRIFSLLLVFALLLSVFPSVYAAEVTNPTDSEEITAATEPTTETEPESSPEATEPTEGELHPALAESGFTSDVIEQSYVTVEDPGEFAISTFALKKTATLRNYDCMDFTTSDGKRQGFHYADEDGKAPWDYMNMIYCLERSKSFSVGSGHAGVGELPIDGSGDSRGEKVWYSLSADQRVAIGLVLLYGAPTKLWDEGWGLNSPDNRNLRNPNVGYRFATQALVWEIADGWREATPPYELKNDYWYERSIGQCTSEDGTVDHFLVGYNSILEDMRMHNIIPSFAGDFAATAPEIQMAGNKVTVTDSNKVLSKFDFTNTDTISYSKNGNNLTITASGAIPSGVQSATATLPDPAASLYEVWYNQFDSSKQACIKVSLPASDPVPAYFKLKGSNGDLSLTKTTEDGKNLSGWKFGVYADQACNSLLAGPIETDSNGKLSVKGLVPGTVWVKELGHKDATINDLYYCESTNPQQVTIVGNQTATVTFHNRIKYGSLTFRKATTSGLGAELGWTANLWRVETNGTWTHIGSGTTKKDADDPTYTFANLLPGRYVLQEDTSTVHPGFTADTEYHYIDVAANQNASITITNEHLGKAQIVKDMPDGGSGAGWEFEIYRASDNAFIGTFITTEDSTVLTDYITPGDYLVYEKIPDGSIYYCESPNPQTVAVIAGETAVVTFTNRIRSGSIVVQKVDTTDTPRAGAEFLLEWSADNITWQAVTYSDSPYVVKGCCSSAGLADGKLVSGTDGMVRFEGLHPELYYRLTETKAPEGLQLLADYAFVGQLPIEKDLTVSLKVVNAPVFTLPKTGSNTAVLLPISLMVCLGACVGTLVFLRRKEQ